MLHPQRRSWQRFEAWQSVETGTAQAATMVIPEPQSEKVCWESPAEVIPEPQVAKVCWEDTFKVIREPPVAKVCWEETFKVIQGPEKISRDPPK